jgi:hypothetical protein
MNCSKVPPLLLRTESEDALQRTTTNANRVWVPEASRFVAHQRTRLRYGLCSRKTWQDSILGLGSHIGYQTLCRIWGPNLTYPGLHLTSHVRWATLRPAYTICCGRPVPLS